MNESREVRSCAEEVRYIEDNGAPKIRGYAAVFNSRSQVMTTPKGKPFVETIAPGAFKRALDGGADVRGLANHEPTQLLGRRGAGTLRIGEDDRGLYYEIDPPDTTAGRDTVASLKRGDMAGSSFAFAVVEDDWSKDDAGMAVRELRSVHLFDVGPVTFPAYLEASAAYRSYDAFAERIAPEVPAPRLSPFTYPTREQAAVLLRLRLIEPY